MEWTEYNYSADDFREFYTRFQKYQSMAGRERLIVDYGEVLGKPEFKVLLNNRWGVKVYPVQIPLPLIASLYASPLLLLVPLCCGL